MKATWHGVTIAEADEADLIRIEGNWYFPPDAVNRGLLEDSSHATTCFWKGQASYYDIVVDGEVNSFGAWYYPKPLPASIERVGRDFSQYVAFWNGVSVE